MADKVATALSLMRRLPPNKIEQNLSGLLNLLPAEQDELLQRIDQPLKVETDPKSVSGGTMHDCMLYIVGLHANF